MASKSGANLYYSPLRYPGGKNCIFPFVSSIFYENGLLGTSYAEPYAGGAGLALRLLFEGYVEHIYINDFDRSIYAFWTSILDKPEEFCRWIKDVRITISNWKKYKQVQLQVGSIDTLELAKSTFFLNRTNISGVIKGGVIGGYSQRGKYKMDARFNKKELIERIERIALVRNRISVSNLDGLSFIKKLDKRKEKVFIYLDPPYYQKGGDLYMNFYRDNDHLKLSQYVRKLANKWMVSYDNHDFILNLYADQHRIVYKLSQSASNRVGDEILIFAPNLRYTESVRKLRSPAIV